MKRHVALRGLSADHHHGLVQARRLTRAAAGKGDAARVATGFLAYAAGKMASHFREEEEILLPELARVVGPEHSLIARTLVEHIGVREGALSLELARLQDEPLAPLMAEVGRRLESHIRFEERELFPAIEQTLSIERLTAVGVIMGAGMAKE